MVENTKHLNILYAEDDLAIAQKASSLFRRIFNDVVHFPNGKEAYEYLQTNHDIDIVITDITMPVMDGLELIRHIRQHSASPIIAITAHGSEYADILHSLNVPRLQKPIVISDLLELVTNMTNNDISTKVILSTDDS